MELSFLKPPKLHKGPLLILVSLLFLLTIIPLCYPLLGYPLYFLKSFNSSSSHQPHDHIKESSSKNNKVEGLINNERNIEEKCEIYKGEWVPNSEAPYYTNTTCWAIHEHQNCMKYGRPDSDFVHWKWKPFGCELPDFNALHFLEIVRGKSMAFVGDSVGRNHLQSLICLLSTVEYPIDVSNTSDDQFKTWIYPSYNFTLSTFWSPHLIKAKDANENGLFNLYLDEFDTKWTAQVQPLDYLIINAGHWFFRPSIYYQNNQIVGCRYCQLPNVTDLPMLYGYKRAFRTAFRAINGISNYNGITFLRTFAPSHFENGEWNKGGNCIRTRPYRSNETKLEGVNMELYLTQLEEFEIAEREGSKRGLKYRLIDTTRAMVLRADGHPSRYGHRPNENVTLYNDCVHWCLPGPIDTWNHFLLHMLKMEKVGDTNSNQYKIISSDRKMKFVR